jgi:hypothetical protein
MYTNLNTISSVVLESNVTPLWNTMQVNICLRLANLSYAKAFPSGSTFQNNIPKITLCNLYIFFSLWHNSPPVTLRLHSDTPHRVGLLWTSDQPDTEVSN